MTENELREIYQIQKQAADSARRLADKYRVERDEAQAQVADLESVAADRYRRIQKLEVECAALKTDRVALVRAWAKHVRWSMRTAYRPEELSGEDLCRDLVSETDFFQERMIEVMEERDALKAASADWKATHDALRQLCVERCGTPIDQQSSSGEDMVLWADEMICEAQAEAGANAVAYEKLKAAAVALLQSHDHVYVRTDRMAVHVMTTAYNALADACGRPDLRWGGE